MHRALLMESGKPDGQSLKAANDAGHSESRRLFVHDKETGLRFLIDTGADLSVFPRLQNGGSHGKTSYQLSAANGTPIATYGMVTRVLNLGLRRDFPWQFVVADVSRPILGADFLAHYGLIPDLQQGRLIDSKTKLASQGVISACEISPIKAISGTSPFHALLERFPEIIRPKGAPTICRHGTKHHIITTPGQPVAQKPRRLAPDKLKIAKREFEAMIKLGLARPSKSPWAAPLHLVPKNANEWRPCGDYRALNSRTCPDKYGVRHIQDFAQELQGKLVFSTIDLVRAFNQIPVATEDIPKTAITTPFGLFEFPYMTFGLRNAAQTFQRFIDEVTRGFDFCYAYIDDILVASVSEREHLHHLEILFQRLRDYGIVVNPSKCVFGQPRVKFLGYLVSSAGTSPLPEKVEAIQNYPKPVTAKQLRRFLGMINFYRRFMPKAAATQAPLNELLKDRVRGKDILRWTSEATDAFEASKEGVAQAASLAHPKMDEPLAVFCDASDFAVGAALQQYLDGGWQPLSFFSKKLSPAERNYSAYDRELLAIYLAIKHFRHMIEARNFTIFTDHKPLTFAFRHKTSQVSPRQFRYLDFISQFTTEIRHIAGDDNVVADALSRIEELQVLIDYEALAASQQIDEELSNLRREKSLGIKLEQVQCPGTPCMLWCDVSTSIIRPFVTAPFRRAAFLNTHRLSHPGVKATVKMMTQRYVWPSIKNDSRKWVQACLECQRSKVTRHVMSPVGTFAPPSSRFEHVHLDIVVMPLSEGYRYCLTMIDRFSRWPEAVPLRDQEAITIARVFYDHWISRFGAPLRVTTDQGRQFESYLFKHLSQLMGSTHIRTTAYHPAANGLVERFHRHLKGALRCHQTRWTEALPTVLLGIRMAWREDLGATAAEMVYGQPVRLPGEFLTFQSPGLRDDGSSQFVKELRQRFQELRPTNGSNHHKRRNVFVFKDLATATHVFVRHDAQRRPLQQPYDGPYPVVSRNDKTFAIQVRDRLVTVSVDRLKPAYILNDEVVEQPVFMEEDDDVLQPARCREPLVRDPTPVPSPAAGSAPPLTETSSQGNPASQRVEDSTLPLADDDPPSEPVPLPAVRRTRSRRQVRFPDRFQAGFP